MPKKFLNELMESFSRSVCRMMSATARRCQISFIPAKVEFDPANYQDESKLLFAPKWWWMPRYRKIMTLENRRWVTYLRDEDARTTREAHDVPEHVFADAKAGQMSQETVEWATQLLERPGVVVVSISSITDNGYYKSHSYFTIKRLDDGSPFVWAN